MKTRIMTKFGMATVKDLPDKHTLGLEFDKSVSLNGKLKTKSWIVSKERYAEITAHNNKTDDKHS